MTRIRAIIVDDETHCIETLQWQLDKYCPTIDVIATANSGLDGIEKIKSLRPQLLFLDIEMPQMNGFEMIKQLGEIDFHIIFTTAYDQFALQAIKVSALDYLVKPIDDDELFAAIEKAHSKTTDNSENIEHLLTQIQSKTLSDRLILPTQNGLEFVDLASVIRCESDSNYTTVFLNDKTKIVVSKTLKEVEEMIAAAHFFRVHNSHYVNLKEVQKYVRGDGGHLKMSDQSIVPVSRSRKQKLLEFLQK